MRMRRGVGLLEYIGSLTILTIFVAGYLTLADQKQNNLAFLSARTAALGELSSQLERVRAGMLTETSGLELTARPGEPEGAWVPIFSGAWTNAEGVTTDDTVRIYKRPHEEGLDELSVMVFWRTTKDQWLHVRADTLRRNR